MSKSEVEVEVFPAGTPIPSRGYEPDDKLRAAIIAFRQILLDRPNTRVSIGQTDRDVQIEVLTQVGSNLIPRVINYYVWTDENGNPTGSRA